MNRHRSQTLELLDRPGLLPGDTSDFLTGPGYRFTVGDKAVLESRGSEFYVRPARTSDDLDMAFGTVLSVEAFSVKVEIGFAEDYPDGDPRRKREREQQTATPEEALAALDRLERALD